MACIPKHTAHHRGIAENIPAFSLHRTWALTVSFSHMPETGLVRALDSRHMDPAAMESPWRCLPQTHRRGIRVTVTWVSRCCWTC